MKKLLLILFIATILLTLSVSAFGAQTTSADIVEELDNSEKPEENAEDENVFTTLYSWAVDNAGEIFSLLTLITSTFLAITYKKGLLPRLGGALGKISASVGNIGKSTDDALSSLGEEYERITERISAVSSFCEDIGSQLTTLSLKLDESCETKSELEKMKMILSSQVDMLYDIFLSSALPQFAKEAVAERVNIMRRALVSEATQND